MSHRAMMDGLVSLHCNLHRCPEPAWYEFYITTRPVDELETHDLDALYIDLEILDANKRITVPDDAELGAWVERAREAGTREDVLNRLAGGYTGAVAVVKRGEGSTVGLRVDIDALLVPESETGNRLPAAEGFRSRNEGFMHTRDRDAHATIGLGVLDAVIDSDFEGTFELLFQPSEKQIAGGKAATEDGHPDDVDYPLVLRVGLDHPTGEAVYNIDGFPTVSYFRVEFTDASAHTGAEPEERKNANLGVAAATQNLYGVFRHSDGATRVNVGLMGGGTATNIVAEGAFIEGEVRSATTEPIEYMEDRAHTVIEPSAVIYDCKIEINVKGKTPSAHSGDVLATIISGVSEGVEGVTLILDRDDLSGSENATYLMRRVQDRGGLVAYVGVDTDHLGGHHIRVFDADEETIRIAVDVPAENVDRIATERLQDGPNASLEPSRVALLRRERRMTGRAARDEPPAVTCPPRAWSAAMGSLGGESTEDIDLRPNLTVIGIVVSVATVQVTVSPHSFEAHWLRFAVELLLIPISVAGAFVVGGVRHMPAVWQPLRTGITLFAVYAISDAADEVVVQSEAVTLVLEDGTLLVGSIALAVGAVRQSTHCDVRKTELCCRNSRLNQFASIVTHDLRNPLNVAQMRLELVREGHGTEHLSTVVDAHDRTETLIQDMPQLARIGEEVSKVKPVSLAIVVADIVTNTSFGASGLTIEADARLLADRG